MFLYWDVKSSSVTLFPLFKHFLQIHTWVWKGLTNISDKKIFPLFATSLLRKGLSFSKQFVIYFVGVNMAVLFFVYETMHIRWPKGVKCEISTKIKYTYLYIVGFSHAQSRNISKVAPKNSSQSDLNLKYFPGNNEMPIIFPRRLRICAYPSWRYQKLCGLVRLYLSPVIFIPRAMKILLT